MVAMIVVARPDNVTCTAVERTQARNQNMQSGRREGKVRKQGGGETKKKEVCRRQTSPCEAALRGSAKQVIASRNWFCQFKSTSNSKPRAPNPSRARLLLQLPPPIRNRKPPTLPNGKGEEGEEQRKGEKEECGRQVIASRNWFCQFKTSCTSSSIPSSRSPPPIHSRRFRIRIFEVQRKGPEIHWVP